MKGKFLLILGSVFLCAMCLTGADTIQPAKGDIKDAAKTDVKGDTKKDPKKKVENRWYTWSDGRDAKGYFHIRKTIDPKRKDEVLLTMEFIANWRGKIVSLNLEETCKNDPYLTLQRIVSLGQGEDEFSDFDATIRWPEQGHGELVTTKKKRQIKLGLPRGTVGFLALFELVQGLPFKEEEVFSFHSLEESELNLKKDHKLTYKGKQRITIGEEPAELHLFEQTGKSISPCLYWLNDEHQLVRVLMDGDKEFVVVDGEAAKKGIAELRIKLGKPFPLPDFRKPTSPGVPGASVKDAIPDQARPVDALLKAVNEGNVELLKSAYSKRMRAEFEKKGWEEKLQEDKRNFAEAFGKYEPSDFTYTYEGGEREGEVKIRHKGQSVAGLEVILEDGAWKINEF